MVCVWYDCFLAAGEICEEYLNLLGCEIIGDFGVELGWVLCMVGKNLFPGLSEVNWIFWSCLKWNGGVVQAGDVDEGA